MARPIILIEGNNGEYGWVDNGACPRQPEHEDTKNMFCPHRDECVLPQIFTRAGKQAEARTIMSSTTLPLCLDSKRFRYLFRLPQPCADMPDKTEANFVI